MESDHLFPSSNRLDFASLMEFTGGDKSLAIKYISIFISTSLPLLNNIQNALAEADGNLLFSALHTLKPQLELIGIKNAFTEAEKALAGLRENPRVDDAIKTSGAYIFNEITLACRELEAIRNNAFKGL